MELVLATRNQHKTREVAQLLGGEHRLIDLGAFPVTEMPDETEDTFAGNAVLKAMTVSKHRHVRDRLVIADDSGLEVDGLEGAPGIYSARYAGENATDLENVNKLLSELAIESRKRSARFRCVIALARNGSLLGTFEGSVEGKITDGPHGTNGFGYDPVFRPNGYRETFAQMPSDLKNKISHRAMAIAALRKALAKMKP